MEVTVKQWGNSASIRLPSVIMKAMNIRMDDVLDIREEDGRIIVEPLVAKKCSLKKLLSNITPENLHNEIEFGSPVGKEIF